MQKKSNIIVRAHAVSDVGQRKKNEDAYLIDEKTGLFLVADGMGGHKTGEVASWFVSSNLNKIIKMIKSAAFDETFDAFSNVMNWDSEDNLLRYAVLSMNCRIFEKNEGMGTTLVSLFIRDSRAFVTHVGDSRAYRISRGSITRLTADHSWVEERVREGKMTADEASLDRRRNIITRSIGFKCDVTADIDMLTLQPPERFLLCSDGLSGVVSESELHSISMKPDIKEACIEMVELAKDMGGRDNITAMLIDVMRRGEIEIETDPPSLIE